MKRPATKWYLICMLAAWLGDRAFGGETILFAFRSQAAPSGISTTDASAQAGGGVLRVSTRHSQPWPGVTLKAPRGEWNLADVAAIAMRIRNTGRDELTVSLRVDNPGADGRQHCLTRQLLLKPGESDEWEVPLPQTSGRFAPAKLFGMRGYPAEMPQTESPLDPAHVTQLLFFVDHPHSDHTFEIGPIRTTESPANTHSTGSPQSFFPLVDTFGQYLHRDWPGKTHSLAELMRRSAEEKRDLAARPAPDSWDKYGGFKDGPALPATGFFRVQKHAGAWWLVDPDGRLFWSHGIDCVAPWSGTPTDDRAAWFQDFPGDKPEFKEFLKSGQQVLLGDYQGRSVTAFDFYAANLKRKFGGDWRRSFAELAHRRLRSWGQNTLGNWSDRDVCKLRKTPYVATVGSGGALLEGSEGYWGKFHDVFDPSFKDSVNQHMAWQQDSAAGDPWCLGFFVDNEIAWGDELSLAEATLRSPATQAAKKVFVDDLKAKYGTIEKLNVTWGAQHSSWQALLESRTPPDAKRTAAREDLGAFYSKFAERYFQICRDAVKAVAPEQLYLGCRFASVNDRAVLAAAKYCDVISYNFYHRSVADFKSPAPDMPLIIGEWHLGALDRGLFHPGLVPVKDQAQRGKFYREYVTGAVKHPQIVGCHWFEYSDEPTTGRTYDGENYQIGFVDIADTPYPETIAASREVGYRLYTLRLGW